MIHWAETHGIELLLTYYFMISILGTMPPLPDNASYFEKWAFAAAHAFCGNMKSVMAILQPPAKE